MDEPNKPQTDTSPDRFFILRDCRALFERRLGEIARHSDINSRGLSDKAVEAFCHESGEAHDELVAAREREGFEQTDGLTASRITLLGHDDLELDIRIGDLINRIKGNENIELWRVQSRYMTLLNRPHMTPETAPTGFEALRCGIWALCRAEPRPLDDTMGMLDRLEAALQERLPELYTELNAMLAERRINPAQAQVIKAPNTGHGLTQASAAPSQPNPFASLQQTIAQRQNSNPSGFGSGGSAAGNGTDASMSAATLLMMNQLMERLSVLEASQAAGGMTTAPSRALKADDINLPPGSPAGIAIDTLSLIFEYILSNEALAEPVKSLISHFQIPLLKIAILDSTFFADPQHPARQFINQIARAAAGIPADAGRDHPVCLRLAVIASSARKAMDSEARDLSAQISSIDALIAERDSNTLSAAQAYLTLSAEHEATQTAVKATDAWLEKTLSKTVHPPIRAFLSTHWLQVMQAAHRNGGDNGEAWLDAQNTIDELLWSIAPGVKPDDRKKLLTLIPVLLRKINTGLDQIAASEEARKPFMDACFELQTAAMRGAVDSQTPPIIAPEPPQARHAPQNPEILERNGKLVQYFSSKTARPLKHEQNSGDWIEFHLPDGSPLCGLLCGNTPSGQSALLFNPDWGYAVALPAEALERDILEGRAAIVSNTALFDAAAAQALRKVAAS